MLSQNRLKLMELLFAKNNDPLLPPSDTGGRGDFPLMTDESSNVLLITIVVEWGHSSGQFFAVATFAIVELTE